MASIDLIRASNGAGDAVQATVTSARVIGATTLKVSDVTNFPEGQFIGTTGTIDNTGVFDPSTLTVFTAHLSGADVEIDTIAPGYADLGNTNGQVLVIKPNTLWADNVADTLAVSHNTDGTLKNKVATLSKINGGSTDGVLLTDASGNVTGGKVTADKIDFTTLLASMFVGIGASVQTMANTGTAGGTMRYVDLGGLKILFGRSLSRDSKPNEATDSTWVLPAGFFSQINYTSSSVSNNRGTAYNLTNVDTVTTAEVKTYLWASTGNGGAVMNLLLIGA